MIDLEYIRYVAYDISEQFRNLQHDKLKQPWNNSICVRVLILA